MEQYQREPQLPRSDIQWPSLLRLIARWALVAGAIYVVGWILWQSGATLTPFIIGLVLAYLLLPIVKRLDRRMPRWASITTVYLVGLVLIELLLMFVVPPAANQVERFVSNIPTWFEQGNTFVNQQIDQFNQNTSPQVRAQVNQQVQNVQNTLQQNASAYAQRVGTFLLNSVIGIFQTITFLFGFLVIPFFLFYILLDANRLPGAINRLLHPNIREDFWNIWHIIDGVFGRYIRGQLVLGLIIGTCSFVGLNALSLFGIDVPYTLLLAIIAGIGELIPVVGPILSAIPAIAVALTSDSPVSAAVAVAILYVIIQQLENQILVPRIVGNTLRLHAAVLMSLLVIAASIGGLLMVILSAPLAAIGRDMFIYFHRRLREPPVAPAVAVADLVQEAQEPQQPAKRTRTAVQQR